MSIPSRDASQPASQAGEAPRGTTRRAMLARAGSFGIASLTLPGFIAACGGGNQSNTGSGSDSNGAPAARGGTLTLAVDGTNGIADPAFYTTLGDWMAVDCICRGLTFIDFHTSDPKPDIAERWEVSDDGRIYRFFLREGKTAVCRQKGYCCKRESIRAESGCPREPPGRLPYSSFHPGPVAPDEIPSPQGL